MSAQTSIEWCDRTWNPVTGCTKVSPGCAHCYAEGVAERFWATQYPPVEYQSYSVDACCPITEMRARTFTDVQTHADRLLEPLSWRKPARVFVNSMSDLFHEDVPDDFIDKVFAVMALAGNHTFQVLTKRPERMRAYMQSRERSAEFWKRACPEGWTFTWEGIQLLPFPLPNVWLGCSVENQHFLERIDVLKDVPAAVRFVSFEPLLEDLGALILDGIHWCIVGGESGPQARPFELDWARRIVRECKAAGVPAFVKQLGTNPVGEIDRVDVVEHTVFGPEVTRYSEPIALKDRKGGNPDEWPADLRVREFPRAT